MIHGLAKGKYKKDSDIEIFLLCFVFRSFVVFSLVLSLMIYGLARGKYKRGFNAEIFLTLRFSWHRVFPDIEIFLTLRFSWHWDFPDIEIFLTLSISWHWDFPGIEVFLTLRFSWHWDFLDIEIFLTLRFSRHSDFLDIVIFMTLWFSWHWDFLDIEIFLTLRFSRHSDFLDIVIFMTLWFSWHGDFLEIEIFLTLRFSCPPPLCVFYPVHLRYYKTSTAVCNALLCNPCTRSTRIQVYIKLYHLNRHIGITNKLGTLATTKNQQNPGLITQWASFEGRLDLQMWKIWFYWLLWHPTWCSNMKTWCSTELLHLKNRKGNDIDIYSKLVGSKTNASFFFQEGLFFEVFCFCTEILSRTFLSHWFWSPVAFLPDLNCHTNLLSMKVKVKCNKS